MIDRYIDKKKSEVRERVSGAWLNTLESHHQPDSGQWHSREKRGRAEEERRRQKEHVER